MSGVSTNVTAWSWVFGRLRPRARSSATASRCVRTSALPRYGSADEVAAMVAYLASSEAGFVTGASLTIDGGFTT